MMRHWLVFLFCALSSNALAAPVTIDRSQAAAAQRRDQGTGLCGTYTHYKDQMAPLRMMSEAVVLMDTPRGDANVRGRVSQLAPISNFHNADPSAMGDFTEPQFPDELFPFSTDPRARPPGNNNNIAVRLRGYLNVDDELAGKIVTFAVNCDDDCQLRIGNSYVITNFFGAALGRVARQVLFTDPGLYPVELLHYQNGSQAYLEWSRASSAEMEGTLMVAPPDFTRKFKLIPTPELFSAISGSSPSCAECGNSDECGTGNFCQDGLCQSCNTADRCGESCASCLAGARICSKGRCVQCTNNAHCGDGMGCNLTSGRCVPAAELCKDDASCAPRNICEDEAGRGVLTSIACIDSSECPGAHYCDAATRFCRVQPMTCSATAECSDSHYCDIRAMQCRPRNCRLYDGGLFGCSATPSRHAPTLSGAIALLVLAPLLLTARRRLRRRECRA